MCLNQEAYIEAHIARLRKEAGPLAKGMETYFTHIGRKFINRTRTEYFSSDLHPRIKAEVTYSLIENPVLIKDKSTDEYFNCLAKAENCYCYDGRILMEVKTTIL